MSKKEDPALKVARLKRELAHARQAIVVSGNTRRRSAKSVRRTVQNAYTQVRTLAQRTSRKDLYVIAEALRTLRGLVSEEPRDRVSMVAWFETLGSSLVYRCWKTPGERGPDERNEIPLWPVDWRTRPYPTMSLPLSRASLRAFEAALAEMEAKYGPEPEGTALEGTIDLAAARQARAVEKPN